MNRSSSLNLLLLLCSMRIQYDSHISWLRMLHLSRLWLSKMYHGRLIRCYS